MPDLREQTAKFACPDCHTRVTHRVVLGSVLLEDVTVYTYTATCQTCGCEQRPHA